MRVVVLGAGAMGMLYGGYLSAKNDVTLIDVDASKVSQIKEQGITILEPNGTSKHFSPKAAASSEGMPQADLVIVFVKAMFSASALSANQALIGPDTFVFSMQNGSGHEDVLSQFAADAEHVVLGTTQHNSSIVGPATIRHGGAGPTFFGAMEGKPAALEEMAANFTQCGLDCSTSSEIRKMIWHKMFTNVSASALTGILQMPLGFLVESSEAWSLTETLLREAVQVANGDGMGFDEEAIVNEVHTHLENARGGITSIQADLRDGRKTEVDTISGSVVRASRRNGVPAPSHEFVVHLVHALEDKNASLKED